MEIATLKPSFTRKLNCRGYSPMHLALEKKHYGTARALMTLDPEVIRVRGREGYTPLHFVAGEIMEAQEELQELLAEFLSTCKSSIEDLTNQCETAVHIAVKKGNTKALEILLGWLKRVHLTKILNWKDQNGNTVLHIAVSGQQQLPTAVFRQRQLQAGQQQLPMPVSGQQQLEIIKLLVGYTNVNAKNFLNRTALDIFQKSVHFDEDVAKRLCQRSASTLSLSQFFSKELTAFEKYTYFFRIQDEATRNIILVVATLIATATYQAVLSPPGGYWQDSSLNPPNNSSVVTANSSGIAVEKPHQAGNTILSGFRLYKFVYLNSTAFFVSIASIGVAALSLWPHTHIVSFSLLIISGAYCVFLVIEFPKSDRTIGLILGEFFWILLATTLWLPFLLWPMHIRVLHRVDATRRRLSSILGSKE
ncbi:ankyrin repeat-containing protein BDA1 [Eucalyptus grandis]|uniref:ankyrin repeat-containing protein BDA1 n=1 Tax=Eucalyptus grandis TaxID=71139 RepID=UPI00192ED528|nr:ankyrin repeat-containing protein BDA1 [Eucalyptus grandis]